MPDITPAQKIASFVTLIRMWQGRLSECERERNGRCEEMRGARDMKSKRGEVEKQKEK